MKTEQLLTCSFCGKQASEVHNLVAGPGVYICDVCVRLCLDIVANSHDDEHGLVLLHELAAASDTLVQRLREAGVDWDRIAEALKP